ncbi:MAG: FUSC family protein [Steroidobacteraceae bacterium]
MNFIARLHLRPLLRPLLQTRRRDVPWGVALRNTVATVLPLAIGFGTGHLVTGLGVSVGALVTMFADQPGPYRLRVQRMVLAALAGAIAAFAGSILGQWAGALLAATALWGFAAGLLVAIGPHATRAGMISMILLVIMGAEPRAAAAALTAAELIFAGGVLQALFAISAWPLQRYRPERLALVEALRGLARAARQRVFAGTPIPLPASLDDLQSLLFGPGRARARAIEAFWVLSELAERMRVELFALADLQLACTAPSLTSAVQSARHAAADVLEAICAALEHGAPPQAQKELARYAALSAAFERHADTSTGEPVPTLIAAARIAALGGQLRAAVRNADAAGSRGEIRAQRAEYSLPRALRPAYPLATLRASLSLSSPAFRHAIRCGVGLACALGVSHMLPLSRGYWMPMTVAIVLKADFAATWRFGLLRVAGTLGGLLMTTVLLHFGLGGFWTALALMTTLCFGYRVLSTMHYGMAVVCLTGVIVILLSFYGIAPETAVHARVIDTILGSALALVAYLIWPTWERGRERELLAAMLDAYQKYLVAVVRDDPHARHEARIAARAARSNVQGSLDRLRDEPTGRANLLRAEALFAQANRFIRAAMILDSARSDTDVLPLTGGLQDFVTACEGALHECAQALRDWRAPDDTFQLRQRQGAFTRWLGEQRALPPEWAAALLDVSDRIVDAIDSVLHALQPRKG